MRWAAFILAAAFPFASTASAQDDKVWQAGLSLSWQSGDYGEPEDTDLLYIPVSVKRYFERGTISMSVPYLDLSTEGFATVIDGAVQNVGEGGSRETGSGLGDIVLRGLFEAKEQEDGWPFIDLTTKLKVPTGDEEKGLGTGEADIGFGVELTRVLDHGFYLMSELGYTFIGEPSGFRLQDRWSYAIGAGRQATRQLQLTAMLDGRTSLTPGNDDPLSLLLFGTWKESDALLLDAMFEFGLNDGSPELGITVGARHRW